MGPDVGQVKKKNGSLESLAPFWSTIWLWMLALSSHAGMLLLSVSLIFGWQALWSPDFMSNLFMKWEMCTERTQPTNTPMSAAITAAVWGVFQIRERKPREERLLLNSRAERVAQDLSTSYWTCIPKGRLLIFWYCKAPTWALVRLWALSGVDP